MEAIPIVPDRAGLDWFRSLTTRRLKQLWDSEQGDVYCDQIHMVMNERGEGHYVAV